MDKYMITMTMFTTTSFSSRRRPPSATAAAAANGRRTSKRTTTTTAYILTATCAVILFAATAFQKTNEPSSTSATITTSIHETTTITTTTTKTATPSIATTISDEENDQAPHTQQEQQQHPHHLPATTTPSSFLLSANALPSPRVAAVATGRTVLSTCPATTTTTADKVLHDYNVTADAWWRYIHNETTATGRRTSRAKHKKNQDDDDASSTFLWGRSSLWEAPIVMWPQASRLDDTVTTTTPHATNNAATTTTTAAAVTTTTGTTLSLLFVGDAWLRSVAYTLASQLLVAAASASSSAANVSSSSSSATTTTTTAAWIEEISTMGQPNAQRIEIVRNHGVALLEQQQRIVLWIITEPYYQEDRTTGTVKWNHNSDTNTTTNWTDLLLQHYLQGRTTFEEQAAIVVGTYDPPVIVITNDDDDNRNATADQKHTGTPLPLPVPSVADWQRHYHNGQGPLLFLPSPKATLPAQKASRQVHRQVRAQLWKQKTKNDIHSHDDHHNGNGYAQRTKRIVSNLGILAGEYHYGKVVSHYCPRNESIENGPTKTMCQRGGGRILNWPCHGPRGSWLDWMAWEVTDFVLVQTQQQQRLMQDQEEQQWAVTTESDESSNQKSFLQEQHLYHHWQMSMRSSSALNSITTDTTEGKNFADTEADEYRFCRADSVRTPDFGYVSGSVDMAFRCMGPMYDTFCSRLQSYVDAYSPNAISNSTSLSLWGKRMWPLPANRRVLFFGNSHTRQVVESLACMYQDQLYDLYDNDPPRSWRFAFANNSTVVHVTNSYAPYSEQWIQLLQDETRGDALDNYDAVILGNINKCGDGIVQAKDMAHFSSVFDSVSCTVPPPTLRQWTEAFAGPIVYVPMFTAPGAQTKKAQNEMSFLQRSNGRDDLHWIDARQHVVATGIECGSQSRQGHLSDCVDGPGHRCEGDCGGHPDLVVWDIIEKLYEIL